MKAAIYCRVSTEDQEKEGTSLQSQLETCLKFAKEKGYQTEDKYIIQETYSGLTLDRPDLARLRGWFSKNEVAAVIIYDSDRFSRDGYDFVTLIRDCQKANVELLCVKEPIEHGEIGELLSYVRGWASGREARKIKERTMLGVKQRAIQGKIPIGGTGKLYGYNYVKGKEENEGIRIVNEGEAKWVREMYRWLVEEGLSTNAITYRLRALNIPTPSGKGYWLKSTVRLILTNPAYCGKTYAFTQTYGEPKYRLKPTTKRKKTSLIRRPQEEWIELPNATPPIISESLFEAAQKQLQRNKELATRNTKRQYLLHGYIYCQRCGRSYWGYPHGTKKGGKLYEHRRYRCSGHLKTVTPVRCSNSTYQAERLESLVWEQVQSVLSKPEIVISELTRRQEEANRAPSLEEELEIIEQRLKELDKEQERLLDYYVMGFPPRVDKEAKYNNKREEKTTIRT